MFKQILSEIQLINSKAQLLAVSKFQPVEKIIALYNQGQRKFGENYVQELTEKFELLKGYEIEWHFIGRLQKNKVKYLIDKVSVIESVDSLELAQEISKRALAKNLTQNIFLQFNLGDESSKGGFTSDLHSEASVGFLKSTLQLEGIRVKGVMALPPFSEDAEASRPYFKKLKQISEVLKKLNHNSSKNTLDEISMGTSHDYKIALSEGTTEIRVGTALFGDRPTKESS